MLIPLNMEIGKSFGELDKQIGKWLEDSNVYGIKNFIIDGESIKSYSHISTNNVIVHGSPISAGHIKDNTSFKVDLVGFSNGVYADAARTIW